MDFQKLVAFHREKNADVTIAMHTCDEVRLPPCTPGVAAACALPRLLVPSALTTPPPMRIAAGHRAHQGRCQGPRLLL
jgi:hypothetical protein